jgi:hypothetical protein
MSVSITFNGTIIEDESFVGTGSTFNDNPSNPIDNNIAAASFPSAINTELNAAITADGVVTPNVNATYFPTYAEKDGIVSITGASGTASVLFSDASGALLNRTDSGLTTDGGTKIYLYTSSDHKIAYGIAQTDAQTTINSGTLVFAVVLQGTFDASGNLTGNFFIKQYQPIHNDSLTNTPDDPSTLAGGSLFVSATQEVVFSDFSAAPSGDSLWVGITPAGTPSGQGAVDILITGINPNPNAPSAGDRVEVSTNGLGENSQAVDHLEGLRFDFVSNVTIPNSTTGNQPGTLAYSQHVESHGAGWSPVQVNPTKARVNALMAAFNAAGDPQGATYFSQLSSQSQVIIGSVQVFDSNGNLFGTATRPAGGGTVALTGGTVTDNNLSVIFNSVGTAEVDGLLSDYRVEFRTGSTSMDRFTITNVTPQTNRSFDIGRIVNLDTGHSSADASLNVNFEDDGPTAAIALNAGVTVTHDESAGAQTAGGATDTSAVTSPSVAALFNSVSNVSTDYTNDDPTGNIYAQSASPVVNSTGSKSGADYVGALTKFSLSLSSQSGVDSGLQTTDGKEIWLFQDSTSGLVIGRIGSGTNGTTPDPNGLAAIAIALNASTGVLSLAQYASLKHGTADTGSDSSEPVKITDTALQAVVTVTDGDGDQKTASTDIGNRVVILDDGPTASITLVSGKTVTHDETPGVDSGSNDTGSTAVGAAFANVANPSTQLSTDTAPFAQNGAIVTIASSSFGADEEGATAAKVVSFVDPQGADSGLKTTAGTSIFLFKEASGITGEDLVVGRIGNQSGQAAFAIAIDQSGVISVAQYASLQQDLLATTPNDSVSITDSALKALVTVTDGDGDTATSSTNIGNEIKFLDDGPSIVVNSNTPPTLTTTDPLAPATSSANGNFGADFTPTFGADGQGATPASYALSLGSTSSGLTDTLSGQSVVLTVSADGSLVTGKTQNSGLTVFTVGVDGTGKVTLTQLRAVVQGTGENPDTGETVGLTGTNVVKLTATATDGDGDQATASLDLTSKLLFQDVGPTITVDNITNGTYTGGGSSTWSENPNADGFKSLNVTLNNYTIDSHSQVTVNSSLGTDTTTDGAGNYIFNGTINDDFNGDGTSDTVSFKLTFNPNNNTYKIDVTAPPTTVQTFDTSQGSLAAGGPDAVQTLTFSSGPSAGHNIVFFGAVPTAPQTDNAVDSPPNDIEDLVGLGPTDLTEAQIQSFLGPPNQIPTLINASTKMNVSTSGIGINNNNLDGSGANIQSTDESFVVNPDLPVDKVTVFIDNSVGGYDPITEDLEYSVYYIDGSVSAPKKVQAVDLHPVTTGVAAGGKSFDISDVAGGPQIDAVQLTMANGTVKIPVIQFAIAQTFTPQSLAMNLTATLTDGDNDTKSDPFSIALA